MIIPPTPSRNVTRSTILPPTLSKSRIPHVQSKLSSVALPRNNPNEMDDIEYLINYAGPLRPKVCVLDVVPMLSVDLSMYSVSPKTGFQLAYDNVHSVFLDYKALVGAEWVSGFFKKLHATYIKDGSTALLDQPYNRIQNLLQLMEH